MSIIAAEGVVTIVAQLGAKYMKSHFNMDLFTKWTSSVQLYCLCTAATLLGKKGRLSE